MENFRVKEMPKEERLRLLEEIWESLIPEIEGDKSPDWHGQVLEERKNKMNSGEAEYMDISEIRKKYQ